MPLGDPSGGNFSYTDEGLPETLFAVSVPSGDIGRSVAFYTGLLGMELLYRKDGEAAVRRRGAVIILRSSAAAGIDTGIYLGVDNPYDLHRRLIDEGVIFVEDPVRGPLGVYTSFRDDDGNILYAMEMDAEIKP